MKDGASIHEDIKASGGCVAVSADKEEARVFQSDAQEALGVASLACRAGSRVSGLGQCNFKSSAGGANFSQKITVGHAADSLIH